MPSSDDTRQVRPRVSPPPPERALGGCFGIMVALSMLAGLTTAGLTVWLIVAAIDYLNRH